MKRQRKRKGTTRRGEREILPSMSEHELAGAKPEYVTSPNRATEKGEEESTRKTSQYVFWPLDILL